MVKLKSLCIYLIKIKYLKLVNIYNIYFYSVSDNDLCFHVCDFYGLLKQIYTTTT